MSKSKSNGLLEYYKEMKNIKEYERNMTGTVILSMIVLIGSVSKRVVAMFCFIQCLLVPVCLQNIQRDF
jgi:hypothetical protein